MSSSSSPIMEHKAQLRKQVSAERSSLSEAIRNQKSAIICQRAIEHLKLWMSLEERKDYIVYTYIPFRAELNVMPIVEWCWRNKIRVAAPRVILQSKLLEFHYIESYQDLLPQPPWGILEPNLNTSIVEYYDHHGYMIVPGVAFDLTRARLGYGGGFYDKFLQNMADRNVRIHKLALALDLQIVEAVPCEQHDLAVDHIITETRAI